MPSQIESWQRHRNAAPRAGLLPPVRHWLLRGASAILLAACAPQAALAADLYISGQRDQVYDGGSYDRLIIQNSTNITVRNARFAIESAGSVVSITGSQHIQIENSDIDGGDVACTGLRIRAGSSDVTVRNNDIHNIADDGLEVYGVARFKLLDNRIYSLLGIGTDGRTTGPCYNGHSDAIELFAVTDSEVVGNLVYDVRWVASIFLSNDATTPDQYCRNILIANNIFMNPESGFVGYIYQTVGLQVVNNVFWWGEYGGIAMGDNVTDMDFTNNIVQSINYRHTGEPYNSNEHRYRSNQIATTAYQDTPAIFDNGTGNFLDPDPHFRSIPPQNALGNPLDYRQVSSGEPSVRIEDFSLMEGSPAVDSGTGELHSAQDILGTARPQGESVDLGAIELVPEPRAALLQLMALLGLAQLRRRRLSGPGSL